MPEELRSTTHEETIWAEQPMASAPRDGSVVLLPLSGWVRAYWDNELETWVLCHPLHMESIRDPSSWRPENEK